MIISMEAKRDVLHRQGNLNLHPQGVTVGLFRGHEFFDRDDLVQVKYEMLRQVRIEQVPISRAVAAFGFSRPAFYQAQAAYQLHGLPGLSRRRPGPRRRHKLTDAIVEFLIKHQRRNPQLGGAALGSLVDKTFGLSVHPRSIERALGSRLKKTPQWN